MTPSIFAAVEAPRPPKPNLKQPQEGRRSDSSNHLSRHFGTLFWGRACCESTSPKDQCSTVPRSPHDKILNRQTPSHCPHNDDSSTLSNRAFGRAAITNDSIFRRR